MKKLFLLITAVLLLTTFLPAAQAASDGITVHPDSVKESRSDTDMAWAISFSAEDAALYEKARQMKYKEACKKYEELIKDPLYATLTPEQYLASQGEDAVLLAYPLVILCEATTQNGISHAVKAADAAANAISISLFDDLLPALIKDGAYTEAEREGFSFTLSLSLALYINGTYKTSGFERTDLGNFAAPATAYIEYDLPDDADNKSNPVFLFAPIKEDILLDCPTRDGYTFTGWVNETGTAADRVAAGTSHSKLTSGWAVRTFQLRYVLTTRSGYNFIKCKNPNPAYFSVGEALELAEASAPSGWVFAGWYLNAEASGEPVTVISADTAKDVVLYAKWLTEQEALNEKIRAAHWGDLDDDGKTTAADARLALRGAVGLEKFTSDLIKRADFAGQGRLSADAARTLLRIAVRLDDIKEILKLYNLI